MAKDTFYFSHDYNARIDEKIKALIRVHGMLGYGVYWSIIEDLYNNANALRTDYDGIAFDLRVEKSIVTSIVTDFNLFIIEGQEFGSSSVERRLNERNIKSEKARESAFKKWNKVKENANALPTQSDGNAIKERKGKEIKEKNIDKFIAPSLSDVVTYFETNGYKTDVGKKAFEYYNSASWIDSKGNKIKNWKQKMIGVWFKDENKKPVKAFTPPV